MPKQLSIYKYNITAAGGTVSFDVVDPIDTYIITATGTPTLLADMTFSTTGTLVEGHFFNIVYTGGVTSNYSGGTTVSFFGVDLTDAQAASKCKITAYYDGSSWDVQISPDLSEQQYNPVIWGYLIQDGTLDTSKIGDSKITYAKVQDASTQGMILRSGSGGTFEELDAKTSGNILIGDGTDIDSLPISGDATLNGSGVLTISSNAINNTKINDSAVTTSKLDPNLRYDLIPLRVTFEVNEQCTYKIKMPYAGTVQEIYAQCVHPISATNNGTITPKNNVGTTMTGGLITFLASDPLETAYTVTPTANNTFISGDVLQFTTAKGNAGGKVQLSIKILRA